MRILYIDCFAGISGDMFLGALLDLGLDKKYLINELKKVPLKGYSIKVAKDKRKGITGTRFVVNVTQKQKERYLKQILDLIKKSKISKTTKERASEIFKLLAKAEAKVHGKSINTVHFHEVGAVDSIIDIIGAVIGIEKLGIDAIYSTPVRLCNGMLGTMPLPAPAASEILKGVPIKFIKRDIEMVTPTGAVLLKSLAKKFTELPLIEIEKIGYGIGTRDDKDLPNVLRVSLGNVSSNIDSGNDSVYVIETNIDDMNPQRYSFLMDKLFEQGAIDVFWTNAQMKKNRPGILITVLSSKEKLDNLINILFQNTTTFGVRYYEVKRRVLDRKIKKIKGLRIKIGSIGKRIYTVSPEYEDWKNIRWS